MFLSTGLYVGIVVVVIALIVVIWLSQQEMVSFVWNKM